MQTLQVAARFRDAPEVALRRASLSATHVALQAMDRMEHTGAESLRRQLSNGPRTGSSIMDSLTHCAVSALGEDVQESTGSALSPEERDLVVDVTNGALDALGAEADAPCRLLLSEIVNIVANRL